MLTLCGCEMQCGLETLLGQFTYECALGNFEQRIRERKNT